MTGLIDYHCHILPGIDDGSPSLDDSLAMAEQLYKAGFAEVYCTPHCLRGVYDNTPATVRAAVAALQEELDRQWLPLKLWPGMEYYLDEFFGAFLADLQPLGATRMVLVEAPPQGRLEQLTGGVFQLAARGYTPLIAHPERFQALAPVPPPGFLSRIWRRFTRHDAPGESADPFAALRQMGCRFQGNIGSLAGYYGWEVEDRARQYLEAGLYDCFGSDGHAPEPLKSYLAAGVALAREDQPPRP